MVRLVCSDATVLSLWDVIKVIINHDKSWVDISCRARSHADRQSMSSGTGGGTQEDRRCQGKAAARGGGSGHVASSVSSMLPGCSVLARGLPSSAPVCASAPGSASACAPVLAAAVAVRSSAALPFAVVVREAGRGGRWRGSAGAPGGGRSAGAHR